MIDQAQIIAGLARAKALFQQRAICAALGFVPTLHPDDPPGLSDAEIIELSHAQQQAARREKGDGEELLSNHNGADK